MKTSNQDHSEAGDRNLYLFDVSSTKPKFVVSQVINFMHDLLNLQL